MRGMALAAANRHSEAISAYEQAALLIPPSHIRVSGLKAQRQSHTRPSLSPQH